MDEFSIIIELVQSVGMWAIFAYLYVAEKRAHEKTRYEYRNDLREVAGLRARLLVPNISDVRPFDNDKKTALRVLLLFSYQL